MFEMLSEHHMVTLIGLGSGILLGLAARLGRFCTLGAIEDLLYGGSDMRMRMWGIAIGTAILGSFGLMAAGLFEATSSYYLSIRWMPLASIVGGLAFGYGMALAGNCGYGAIATNGKVQYDECFQCLDCVVIHESDALCAPRILERKRARTIPIVPAAGT